MMWMHPKALKGLMMMMLNIQIHILQFCYLELEPPTSLRKDWRTLFRENRPERLDLLLSPAAVISRSVSGSDVVARLWAELSAELDFLFRSLERFRRKCGETRLRKLVMLRLTERFDGVSRPLSTGLPRPTKGKKVTDKILILQVV